MKHKFETRFFSFTMFKRVLFYFILFYIYYFILHEYRQTGIYELKIFAKVSFGNRGLSVISTSARKYQNVDRYVHEFLTKH